MPDSFRSHLERLPLDSLYNARDLGGVPLPDGRSTAHGRFLRSDETAKISDLDIDRLLAFPVRLVIDLRTPDEISQLPSRFFNRAGIRYENISLLGRDLDSGIGAVKPHRPDRSEATLGDLYIHMLRFASHEIATVFNLLAGQETGASLFHCLHGKDRTGLVAALLLKLAGASDAAVIENYAVSCQLLWPWFRNFWHSIPRTNRRFLNTDPQNMAETLAYLTKAHGGAESYLLQAGVTRPSLERLRLGLTATA